MKLRSILVTSFTTALVSLSAMATEYTIDASHSNVGFTIRHFVSKVGGGFSDFSGTIQFDEKNLEKSSASAVIKAASINTLNAKRDGHLKSPDFFNVEKHADLSFQSKKFKKTGTKTYVVDGDFTMLGVTKPVSLKLEYAGSTKNFDGIQVAGFVATGKINRKDFGMVWNKTLDKNLVLGEEVDLTLNLEAIEKK